MTKTLKSPSPPPSVSDFSQSRTAQDGLIFFRHVCQMGEALSKETGVDPVFTITEIHSITWAVLCALTRGRENRVR
jgi:hypothetical protein